MNGKIEKLSAYADDVFVLVKNSKEIDDTFAHISEFCSESKAKINILKSKLMCINIEIIGPQRIPVCDNIKIIGMNIEKTFEKKIESNFSSIFKNVNNKFN